MNSCPAISALVRPVARSGQHFLLAPGQPERMRPGRGARPGRNRADTALAHRLPGHPDGGHRPQVGQDRQRPRAAPPPRGWPAGPAPLRTGSPGRARGGPRPTGRRPAHADRPRQGAARPAVRAGAPQPDRHGAPIPHVGDGRHVVRQPGLARRLRPAVPPARTPRRGPAAPARCAAARQSRRRSSWPGRDRPRRLARPGGPGSGRAGWSGLSRLSGEGSRRLSSSRLRASASAQRPVRSRAVIRSLRRHLA